MARRRNKKKNKTEEETETLENQRLFGKYRCTECSRFWASAYSWLGYDQQCRNCKTKVMAFFQKPLRKRKNKKKESKEPTSEDKPSEETFVDKPPEPMPKKPHLRRLCGKCRALGHSCTGTRDRV